MRLSLSKVLMLAAALVLVPATVNAQSLLTQISPDCTTDIHLFSPSPTGPIPATTPQYVCLGSFAGNNLNQEADVFYTMAYYGWGSPWFNLGTTNAGDVGNTGPFKDFSDGISAGTLEFKTPLATVFPFVLALKAGSNFSLFYFADYITPLQYIDYTTAGVSQNVLGAPQGLSHATLYSTVPEPSTVILLGTGLLGLFGVEYRRRKKA